MNRLKEFREKRGFSQKQLAFDVNVSARHIAFIENGSRNPSIELAFKIAKALNATLEDIFLPS